MNNEVFPEMFWRMSLHIYMFCMSVSGLTTKRVTRIHCAFQPFKSKFVVFSVRKNGNCIIVKTKKWHKNVI